MRDLHCIHTHPVIFEALESRRAVVLPRPFPILTQAGNLLTIPAGGSVEAVNDHRFRFNDEFKRNHVELDRVEIAAFLSPEDFEGEEGSSEDLLAMTLPFRLIFH